MKWVLKRLAFPRLDAGNSQQVSGRPARSEVAQTTVIVTGCVGNLGKFSGHPTALTRLARTDFAAEILDGQLGFSDSAGPKRVGHLGNSRAFSRGAAPTVAINCQTPY